MREKYLNQPSKSAPVYSVIVLKQLELDNDRRIYNFTGPSDKGDITPSFTKPELTIQGLDLALREEQRGFYFGQLTVLSK
jgi:hypothetical protein